LTTDCVKERELVDDMLSIPIQTLSLVSSAPKESENRDEVNAVHDNDDQAWELMGPESDMDVQPVETSQPTQDYPRTPPPAVGKRRREENSSPILATTSSPVSPPIRPPPRKKLLVESRASTVPENNIETPTRARIRTKQALPRGAPVPRAGPSNTRGGQRR
jgi:hypothetical protein